MAKDYGRKQLARPKSGGISKQLLLIFVAFLLGYLSASIFDFTSLSGWVNNQLLAKVTGNVLPKAVPQQAELPKPKFEFYTLLTSEQAANRAQTPVSEALPKNTAMPLTSPPGKVPVVPSQQNTAVIPRHVPEQQGVSKQVYYVQVAAFKTSQDAERIKASFTLKGFTANVVSVNQQGTHWYRVVIGPYSSRDQAQKAQGLISRSEHILGMIRKMDA